MKIIVSTHQGKLYDEEVDYVVVNNNEDGEFAIMKNHIPVVCVLRLGSVKLVAGPNHLYLAVRSGMLEFKEEVVNIIAQEAHIGRDKESALKHLIYITEERLELNRKANADFTQKEKEIIDNLRTAKAGHL